MNALLPIETVAERLGLSTRSIYRLEREGKLARRATQPGEHPCWTEAVIQTFEKGKGPADALMQQDIEDDEATRALIIPCGDSDLAIRQLLRAALKLEPHVPEAEVLDAVLTLQAQRDALHRDYEAANRKLRLWATALRHIKKTVDDLREPPTALDLINREVRDIRRKSGEKNTPEAILAERVPDIQSCQSGPEAQAAIKATLAELEATGFTHEEASTLLNDRLKAVGPIQIKVIDNVRPPKADR